MNPEVRTKPDVRTTSGAGRNADIRTTSDAAANPDVRTTSAVKSDKSLPALFSDLAREMVDLIRKEAALARAEVSEKLSSAQTGVTSLALGAAMSLAGIIIVLIAISNALAMVLPPDLAPWLAPLLVGAVVLIIGYAMVKSGQSRLKAENLVPERTVSSLRADRAIVEEKTR